MPPEPIRNVPGPSDNQDACRRLTPGVFQARFLHILVLAFVAASPAPAADPAAGAMTNEDVVRMTASGRPASAIVEAIRSAPAVDFDMDPEIVTELRRVRVDESVIEAMREASARNAADPPPSPEDAPMGSIALSFDDQDLDPLRSTIVAPALDEKDSPVSLSLFIVCVSPTHVPDLWQEHTPLSAEFPRHRLLLLHEETRKSTRRGREMIHLDKPEGRSILLPAGNHHLVVGVAARAGDKPWVPIVEDSEAVVVGPGAIAELKIRLRTADGRRRMGRTPYTCEIVGKAGEEARLEP